MKYINPKSSNGGGYEYRTEELIEVRGNNTDKTVTVEGPCILYTGSFSQYGQIEITCDGIEYAISNRTSGGIFIAMDEANVARGNTSNYTYITYCTRLNASSSSLELLNTAVNFKLEWVPNRTSTYPSNGNFCYLEQLFADKSLTIHMGTHIGDNTVFVIKKLIKK